MNARITRSLVAVAVTTAVTAGGAVALSSTSTAATTSTPAVVTSTDHGRTDFGFVSSTFTRNGVRYVRFDRAVMLTGAAAARAKAAHGLDPSEPPDYYIQNDNPRLRTYALARDVRVVGSQVLTGSPALKPVTLQRFVDHVRTRPAGATYPPFVLTFAKGKVVKITEQYVA